MLNNQMEIEPPNRLAGDRGFKNKTLLITGVTGFVGKVLIEKMLRSCPLVKKIYVIVRVKKGKNPQIRLKEMFDSPLYDLIKNIRGEEIFEKVIGISGDISDVNLGLSSENWKMLAEEVEIIFHVAATVRFDDPLKKSVLLNSRGTKLLLQLAKECKQLLVFAHVSTAYCHPHEKILYEKMYSPTANPDKIINVIELLDEEIVNSIAKKLKGDYPNTYTYTKALGEGLVNNEMDNLPVIILRPSVVIPIWIEPLPGWTDNLNGVPGLLVAAGKGICRTVYCKPTYYADYIPVDVVANSIMLATHDYMVYKKRRIFNLTTSSKVKITWSNIVKIAEGIGRGKMPLNWAVWYPGGSLKSSRLIHNICVVLFHYIPAIIVDSLLILTGNKPVLWKVQRKLTKGFELFEYYATNQWYFNDDKFLEAIELANDTERKIYRSNLDGFDFEPYFYKCIHSIRLYLLKESDESLPTARRHMKIMWAVDRICKFLILFGFGYFLMNYFVYPILDITF